jgi:hypothetical protein
MTIVGGDNPPDWRIFHDPGCSILESLHDISPIFHGWRDLSDRRS